MRQINRITGIEGVIPGGNATVSLPVGRRYHGLTLYTRHEGVLAAADSVVGTVRMIVNGVTIRDLTAAQILKIAKLNGVTAKTGELPIFFSLPWAASVMGEEATSWDMADQSSFKIEVELKSQAPAETVSLSGIAEFDYVRNRDQNGNPAHAIQRQTVTTYNVPAGDYDIDTLPQRFPISRILLDSGVTINTAEVTADGVKIHETNEFGNRALLAARGLDSTALKYPIVFNYTQQITDVVQVRKSLNVRINSGGAGAVGVITENIAPGFI